MKRSILTYAILLLTFISSICKSETPPTQPTIMVVPSDKLMHRLGYLEYMENQGLKVPICDYQTAMIEDQNLKQIISKIGEIFSDRGFALVDLESTLRSIREENADDLGWTSRNGAGVAKNSMDIILSRAKPDIRLDLDYEINQGNGPFRYVEFTIQAIDSYSKKQVGAAGGKGANSTESADYLLLEEAVNSHITNLQGQMQAHFTDQLENGREIFLRIQVFEDSDIDLEEEFGDLELNEIVDDWMKDNSLNGQFSRTKLTANELRYSQVRIKCEDADGRRLEATDFVRDLRKYLSKNYNIRTKNVTQGLGNGQIIIRGLK